MRIHLQFLWARSRAYGERERVVELVNNEIKINGLLPVDVRIADRQLLAVLAKYIDLRLEFRHVPRRSFNVLLADEEQKIVTVYRVLRLEEKVTNEQIGPVGRSLEYHETGV